MVFLEVGRDRKQSTFLFGLGVRGSRMELVKKVIHFCTFKGLYSCIPLSFIFLNAYKKMNVSPWLNPLSLFTFNIILHFLVAHLFLGTDKHHLLREVPGVKGHRAKALQLSPQKGIKIYIVPLYVILM